MSTFGQEVQRDALKPALIVPLPPSAFKDGPQKPNEPRDVGLRLLSEGDLQAVRGYAARTTATAMKGIDPAADVWIEAYNNALMIGAVCAALCHPEDTSRDYWEIQQSSAPTYLSPGGVERIWDELETLKIKSAPTAPEASPDDIASLAARLLNSDYASRLPHGDARAMRRMLRHILDTLEAYDPTTPDQAQ